MQETDRRIALLRLLLADIMGRERETNDAVTQLRKQLARIVDFTVQYNGSVAGALSSLSEVEERLTQQETALRHLEMLRKRASGEIQALLVTRGVANARARLAELEAQRHTLVSVAAAPPEVGTMEGDSLNLLTSTNSEGIITSPSQEVREREQHIAEIDAEIAELQAQIQAASEAAARALTSGGHGDPLPQQQ